MEKASTQGWNWREVTEALNVAVAQADAAASARGEAVRNLAVVGMPELPGARISGCCAEVYVVAKRDRLSVECWRGHNEAPYKTVPAGALEAAARAALAEL